MPDIFLYSGEPNQNDVRLADPTVLRGGAGSPQTITGTAIAEAIAFGTGSLRLTVAGTGKAQTIGIGSATVSTPTVQTITGIAFAEVIGFGSSTVSTTAAPPAQASGGSAGTFQPRPSRQLLRPKPIIQPIRIGTPSIGLALSLRPRGVPLRARFGPGEAWTLPDPRVEEEELMLCLLALSD